METDDSTLSQERKDVALQHSAIPRRLAGGSKGCGLFKDVLYPRNRIAIVFGSV